MTIYMRRYMAAAVVALGIVLGCSSVVGPNGTTTGGNEFTTAPGVPGGISATPNETVVDPTDTVDLPGEATRSFFTAFQVDPVREDSAGPKFVVAGDVDQDGLMDLVSAWNQSQPVQLHLQRRDPDGNISFRTVTLAGTAPIAVIAGLELGQINDDGFLDVIVLSKATGSVTLCPKDTPSVISALEGEIIVLFNPADAAMIPDGDTWTEMILSNSYISERWIHNQFPGIESVGFEELKTQPEDAGFTALAVGNIDGVPGDEIVVAINPGVCEELGQDPPINTVDLWINPNTTATDPTTWGVPSGITLNNGVPISIMADAPFVTDVALTDVDGDGDLDIVAAYSNSITLNLRWARNPLDAGGVAALTSGSTPGVDLCDGGTNDKGLCPGGDVDCLGVSDGACNGGVCSGGANPGASCTGSGDCAGVEDGKCIITTWRYFPDQWEIRPIGQIDTNANIVTIGDVDGDGFDDVMVRSQPGQIVQWFRRPSTLVIEPEFPPSDPIPTRFNFPWAVFTLTEFDGQTPEAIAIGDITGDGVNEAMVAVAGGVFWYDSMVGESVFDPWFPTTIIQDTPTDTTDPTLATGGGTGGAVPGTGVGVGAVDTSTYINTLLVVDLDGDGKNDVVGTLDRRSGSGLSDDRLVWYRNTRDE